MSLETPESVGQLQRRLYDKAKLEPSFRFYLLYDKIYRPDVLRHAWELCRHNGGSPGVDGVTFEKIETQGIQQFLDELGKDLHEKTYRPQPVRRVMIPKAGGGERPLGIPTIRDRVAQTAAKLVLEPIFEADFVDEAYGYRPGRGGLDAVKATHKAIRQGRTQVVDADLSKFFDTIPHAALMKSVARRISDGAVLHLVKLWLEAPVEERSQGGCRTMRGSRGMGTPQGGVISPLLANIYMHRFLKAWHAWDGPRQVRGRLVNYADDFVILCPTRVEAETALSWSRQVFTAIGLTLNEDKTRLCDARRDRFKFLGYDFGADFVWKTGEPYLSSRPAKAAIQRLKDAIRAMFPNGNMGELPSLVTRLNQRLKGWANYFSYGTRYPAYRAIDNHVVQRVRAFLQRRHKVPGRGTRRFPDRWIFEQLGIVRLVSLLPPPKTT